MPNIVCPQCRQPVPAGQFCLHCAAPLPYAKPRQTQSGIMGWWNEWKKANPVVRGVIIVGVILIAIGMFANRANRQGGSSTGSSTAINQPPSKTPSKPPPEINAEVRFTGTQFIIKNTDSYDWTDVKMEINGGLFSGGYELKHPVIRAKETYTVGALQFADSDGQRFNPYQMKPQRFVICGQTPNGRTCYTGGWD